MFVCTKCQKEYASAIQFCGECGGTVEERLNYCANCMLTYDNNTKFCHKCGGKLTICSALEVQNIQNAKAAEMAQQARAAAEKKVQLASQVRAVLGSMPKFGISNFYLEENALMTQGILQVNAEVKQSFIGNTAVRSLWSAGAKFQLDFDAQNKLAINPQSVFYYNRVLGSAIFVYLLAPFVFGCAALGLWSVDFELLGGVALLLALIVVLFFVLALCCDKRASDAKLNEGMIALNNKLAETDFSFHEKLKIAAGFRIAI